MSAVAVGRLVVVDRPRAAIVFIDGVGLPQQVYADYDVSTIEDQLVEILDAKGIGKLTGNEFGPRETALFVQGPDAERLFASSPPSVRLTTGSTTGSTTAPARSHLRRTGVAHRLIAGVPLHCRP